MFEITLNDKYEFNAERTVNELIEWIRNWFAGNGGDSAKAILGMSGGKDSTVAAALLCKALGPDRVIGVSMPDRAKGQGLNDADRICEFLGIKMYTVDVSAAVSGAFSAMEESGAAPSNAAEMNIPPRIRMTVLYTLGQTLNCRVVNTCNLSEDYVGYATKFGDAAGDFSLFANLTVTEVLAIGDYLGIPREWVHKTPDDGLPHSCPDEEKFGYTYAELDVYLRTGKAPEGHVFNDPEQELVIDRIKKMHQWNLHKLLPMPAYTPVFE